MPWATPQAIPRAQLTKAQGITRKPEADAEGFRVMPCAVLNALRQLGGCDLGGAEAIAKQQRKHGTRHIKAPDPEAHVCTNSKNER